MENMDKGLTVPRWVLINRPKLPQIVCSSPKGWDFDKKKNALLGVLSPYLLVVNQISLKFSFELKSKVGKAPNNLYALLTHIHF